MHESINVSRVVPWIQTFQSKDSLDKRAIRKFLILLNTLTSLYLDELVKRHTPFSNVSHSTQDDILEPSQVIRNIIAQLSDEEKEFLVAIGRLDKTAEITNKNEVYTYLATIPTENWTIDTVRNILVSNEIEGINNITDDAIDAVRCMTIAVENKNSKEVIKDILPIIKDYLQKNNSINEYAFLNLVCEEILNYDKKNDESEQERKKEEGMRKDEHIRHLFKVLFQVDLPKE